MFLDYLIFIPLSINTILSLGVLLHNSKAKINKLYFLFVTSLSLWSISNFLENEPEIVSLKNLELFLRLDFVFAIILLYAWFRFCIVFTNSKLNNLRYQWLNRSFLLITILFSALSLTNLIIKDISFYDNVIHFKGGVLWSVYAFLILFFMISGLIFLFLGRLRAKAEGHILQRQQINLVFLGFIISFVNAAIINIYLQPFQSISLEISRLGIYGMIFLVAFTGYAIVKKRLFEFRLIIARAVAFLFLTIIIAGIYSAILFGGTIFFFGSMINNDIIIIGIVLSTIIALSFHSLYHYIENFTDKLFFKGQYNVEHLLSRLTMIMAENIDFEFMTENILSILTKEMRISKAAFLSIDKNKTIKIKGIGYNHHKYTITELKPLINEVRKSRTMKNHAKSHHFIVLEELDEGATKELFRKLDIAITIPIRIKREEIIILIVGPKLSGEMYYQKDIDLLAIFAPEAAIAIQNTKAYAEIKKLNEKLEQRVKERTVQIHQLQEKQNQMMIDISHSLQTPLTVMKGELDFLKKRIPNDKKIKVFEKTINDVSHFIYNLLDLARLETTYVNIKKESVNLSQLLEEQIEYFEVLAEDKGITISSDIENKIIILASKKELEELVVGLVSNSMKYMQEKDEKKIFIELHKINNVAQLTIQDTGIGISKKDLPHIFDRFYRVENSHDLNLQGAGLGLTICKKIVEKHNGTIDVESEFGEGTKFTIKFPIIS